MARRLARAHYTVGWICALPIELAAAQELLDEEHGDLPQDSDDFNIYTFGRIGEHNVVFACLPAGQTGTNSAAAVAMQMKSSFPSVRFALMVGIGGGVPSAEADVRLGDVVVSQPEKGHGGVIQYDFGKMTPGKIERTGFLNTPPRILLSAVAKLRAKHDRGRSDFPRHMSKLSRLPKFVKEKAGVDVLFRGDYDHEGGTGCELCDIAKRVNREDREDEFVTHYGTIASGNMVMRDGKTRDGISSEFGGVLCFEMEAAGLMNSFPCLVIRGICDYADSHKNKKWQPYAAATAAAYAKELLLVMPAAEVAKTRTVEEATSAYRSSKTHVYLPFSKNRRFVGRITEFEALQRKLLIEQDCQKVAIVGLGGIGKTQVALSFAYYVRETQPETSVFWVPALSNESFDQAFEEIAKLLGISPTLNSNEDVKRLVQRQLSANAAGKWLLVVDNADDREVLRAGERSKGVLEYLPKSSSGMTIFTTRSREVAQSLVGGDIVEITRLENHEAMSLLEQAVVKIGLLEENVSSYELLEMLDNLPLAITQAAAYMYVKSVPVSEYLQLSRRADENVIEMLSIEMRDHTRYEEAANAVAKTWVVSFQQILKEDALAADLLRYMSCIEWKAIPHSILPTIGSDLAITSAIGTLCSYSFVTKRSQEKMYDMHRLVHLASRVWNNRYGDPAKTLNKAMRHISNVFPSDDWANREIWREYLPHVGRLRQTCGDKPVDGRADLCRKAGVCLTVDGKSKEAIIWLLESWHWTNELDEDDPDRLGPLHDLARAYHADGRVKKAINLLQHVVAIREKVLSENHPDRLHSQHELASAYGTDGQARKAIKLLEHVVAIRERVLAEDHPDRLHSQHELARAYGTDRQAKKAIKLLEHVLAIEKRVHTEDHPHRRTSQHALAIAYRTDGQVEKAVKLLEQVVTIDSVLLEDHPDRLTSQRELIIAYQANGQGREAEELLERIRRVPT